MPVHANSVLSTQIQTLNADFYQKLADMEYYTYENSEQEPPPSYDGTATVAGYDQYSPFWQSYSDVLVAYLQNTVDSETLKNFIIGLYGFLSRHESQGYGDVAKKQESNAAEMFTIDGLIDIVMGYPLNHYDDYVFPVPTTDPETGETTYSDPEAPNLEADTAYASGTFETDSGTIPSLQAYFVNLLTGSSIDDIFGNAAPVVGDFNPQIAWDIIFDELNWQWAIELFNMDFDIPPRPELASATPFDPTLPPPDEGGEET